MSLKSLKILKPVLKKVILDVVKDHLIPHLVEKKNTKEIWDTWNQLFESKNENHKITLKDNLYNVKMSKDESVAFYLTRVAQVKDALAVVGETGEDNLEAIHQ